MDTITRSKMYELILTEKQHQEERRDEINKSYTSLFTGIIALTPLIDKLITAPSDEKAYIMVLSVPLAIIGTLVSISWLKALKRINNYITSYEKVLIEIEKENPQKFLTKVADYLYKVDSPDSIAKQEMWLPYTFGVAFVLHLAYALYTEIMLYYRY